MKTKQCKTYLGVIGIFLLFSCLIFMPLSQADAILPPPQNIPMNLEQTIFRRMSIREFTNDSITDEQLATILWTAQGIRSDGNRTIAAVNGTFASIIYVIKQDAAYTYNPLNHSLQLYKTGDWRSTVGYQYPSAPLVLGICWNTTLTNEYNAGVEIGEICQNIQLTANALNLGTVVTGGLPPAINRMGIPTSQQGLIVMPIGHPLHPYNFKKRLLWLSPLPKIQENQMNLTTALQQRTETTNFSGDLTKQQISQLIWSSYGFSSYIDKSNQDLNTIKRHRTVPSAHAYYPLELYTFDSTGIYAYQPNLLTELSKYPADFFGLPVMTYLKKIQSGDHRLPLAQMTSYPALATAPFSIVMVLNINKTQNTGSTYLKFWYYESGAAAHNIMLEATALGLKTNTVFPTDSAAVLSLLKLPDGYTPLLIVPISAS